jgi:CPA1 family monovalent cation:H+ antiporter
MPPSAGLETQLLDLLVVFFIGASVGVFVAKIGRFPYTVALLLAGLGVSITPFEIDLTLSHDLILLVLLPPLLFEGAATTDFERLRRNLVPILAIAVPGLLGSIALLGWLGTYAFDFPLLIALVFAAMMLPTDPVSVLALFEEVGAPERLSVLVEGESLLNDGVSVVVFTTLFSLVTTGQQQEAFANIITLPTIGQALTEIVLASLGGAVVGLAAGYAVYHILENLDEHMTELVLTIILAYGSFLVAEHYLHVSGVIATVIAGLFIGNAGVEYAMSPRTKISVFNAWDTGAFLSNTVIFLLIGAKTPINQILGQWRLIAIAIVLVLIVRAFTVYPLTTLTNQVISNPVSVNYQHVLVWGGLHTSISIALVLGLPDTFPYRNELRAMVFGVAAFGLIVQGLSMQWVLDRFEITTRSEAEKMYELLVGRLRLINVALDVAENLYQRGDLPNSVYEDFRGEYEREATDLEEIITTLLEQNPEVRREERLSGERRVLHREKSAAMELIRDGVVADDVGQMLLEEVDLKLEQLQRGETTVTAQTEEGYREFWRSRIAESSLDLPVDPDDQRSDVQEEDTDE